MTTDPTSGRVIIILKWCIIINRISEIPRIFGEKKEIDVKAAKTVDGFQLT